MNEYEDAAMADAMAPGPSEETRTRCICGANTAAAMCGTHSMDCDDFAAARRRIAALEAALLEIRGGLVALSEHCTSRNAVVAPEVGAAAYVVPCDKMEAWLAPLYTERNAHVLRDPTAALDAMLERAVREGNRIIGVLTKDDAGLAAAIVKRVKECR